MDIDQELGRELRAGIRKNEPMSLHTSWKVGGPADYFLAPADRFEIAKIVCYSREHELPLFVFGNGSNLLVRDGGIRGLVMQIGPPFHYIRWEDSGLVAGSGTPMPYLAQTASRKGWAGLEFAGGIPGTLGGALIMNAGAFGKYTGDLVRAITVVTGEAEICRLEREQLVFGYRHSNLAGAGIVVEALLQLEKGDPAELERKVGIFLAERRRRHPQLPSAGSVFRNMPDQPAGRLIEAAGGKGLRSGCAQVSEQHANFIVNLGGATAADILTLIDRVQRLVKNRFNIELHPEVKVVGEEK
ncbi:MAG: UDP-N-acetylmuramate dehydrogenase [Bacillota bacterium]